MNTPDIAEILADLRRQADEISEAGINGWGNTMTSAADLIERLRAQVAPAGWKLWCETCNGSGKVYQEHQAGCWVGGDHNCPDCSGQGYYLSPAAPAQQAEPVACGLIDALAMLRELREWDHRGDTVQEHWDEIYGAGAFDRAIADAEAALQPAQPSAQGTGLTDEALGKLARETFDGCWHEDSTLTEAESWVIVAKEVRAAVAQAPAPQGAGLTEEAMTRALNLAYQFRSHPASRGIDDIEQAGEMILSLLSAAEPQWQPIETAPKQPMKSVVLWRTYPDVDDVGGPVIAHWSVGYGWVDSSRGTEWNLNGTHWMPLPPPPAAMASAKEQP